MRFEDLTGIKFGRLTPITHFHIEGRKGVFWECLCDCGNKVVVAADDLRRKHGPTKSCGCLKRERLTKHGKCNTRLHSIWSGMRQRCNDPSFHAYRLYGALGIKVCEEWEDFAIFYSWAINNGYKDNLTLDRIDNYSGYSPDNCRWVTPRDQMQNLKHNVIIYYNDEKLNLAQLARKLDLPYNKVYNKYLKHNLKSLDKNIQEN